MILERRQKLRCDVYYCFNYTLMSFISEQNYHVIYSYVFLCCRKFLPDGMNGNKLDLS